MSTKSLGLPDRSTSKEGSIDEETLKNFQKEEIAYKSSGQYFRDKKQELENRAEEQKQKLREDFAGWAKRVTNIWIGFIMFLLIIVGVFNGFDVDLYPKEVLITLLATTTINVIALSLIIVKGLFLNEKNSLSK